MFIALFLIGGLYTIMAEPFLIRRLRSSLKWGGRTLSAMRGRCAKGRSGQPRGASSKAGTAEADAKAPQDAPRANENSARGPRERVDPLASSARGVYGSAGVQYMNFLSRAATSRRVAAAYCLLRPHPVFVSVA